MLSLLFTGWLSTNWTHSISQSSANCQLWNSQSNSLLQLPTILLPFLLNYLQMLNLNSQFAWYPHYIASGHTQQKTPFPNNPFIVACVFVAVGTCLPSHCLAINVSSGSPIPVFRHHVTIYNTIIHFLDITHSTGFNLKCFGEWTLSPECCF
jgi:hypothetical protein